MDGTINMVLRLSRFIHVLIVKPGFPESAPLNHIFSEKVKPPPIRSGWARAATDIKKRTIETDINLFMNSNSLSKFKKISHQSKPAWHRNEIPHV